MDPLQLLADLEGLRDKIPASLQADFENLISDIRKIYEMSIKFVTPPQPVQDGKQNLAAHYTVINDLYTQLESSLPSFQQVYVGKASDTYQTTATASLQSLQLISEHLATASQQHGMMATNFELATEAKIALVALLVGLGVTLGVLVFSAGTTAPVTVPAAALETVGGIASIGLLTEAEAAAATAVMGLIWSSIPDALLSGLLATAATEFLVHTPITPITPFSNVFPNNKVQQGSQTTILTAHSHQDDLPIPGKATGPNVYNPPKNRSVDQAWNKEKQGFADSEGRVWSWDTKHKDHWDVQLKDGSHINVFPDGVERGERGNDTQNQGKKSGKGKK